MLSARQAVFVKSSGNGPVANKRGVLFCRDFADYLNLKKDEKSSNGTKKELRCASPQHTKLQNDSNSVDVDFNNSNKIKYYTFITSDISLR